jgi:predicted HD phosphohydrolase
MSRHIHDRCFAISRRCLEVVASLLRDEEHGDFTAAVYAIAVEEFRRYDEARARERRQMRPLETPHDEGH